MPFIPLLQRTRQLASTSPDARFHMYALHKKAIGRLAPARQVARP
jgi:hypothetical protein